MTDPDEDERTIRLRRWSLLCPHQRLRATLELQVEADGVVLLDCSARGFAPRGRCDQACMRAFRTEADPGSAP